MKCARRPVGTILLRHGTRQPGLVWVSPQTHCHWAHSTGIWRFSCYMFQFRNQSVADVLLLFAHYVEKKPCFKSYAVLSLSHHESGQEFLSNINSHNNTMRYIISSKTLYCVAKSETVQSSSLHSRCPTKAHVRGVFVPQARHTEWLLAGCWWQPLLPVPDWQSTTWRLYHVLSENQKSFLKPGNLILKKETLGNSFKAL